MIFYFSGTGNSRWVAECIGKGLNERTVALSDFPVDTNRLVLRKGERLGFVFPVYSWAPPGVLLRFVKQLCIDGIPKYVYFVCTCGDDTGKTADVFRRVIEKKGWKCSAGFSITMPNSYVCLPGFNVDAAGVAEEKLCQAIGKVEQVINKLRAYELFSDCHEGSFPRMKTYFIRPLFEYFLMSPRLFRASDRCISCGLCVKVCPLHNVHLQEGRPKWGNRCAMCLACYHHCPRHAISYGRQTSNKGRYVFPTGNKWKKP